MWTWFRANVWKAARKRKSWARFNFYVCARPSIHRHYFVSRVKCTCIRRKHNATVKIQLYSNAAHSTLKRNNSCKVLLCLRHFTTKALHNSVNLHLQQRIKKLKHKREIPSASLHLTGSLAWLHNHRSVLPERLSFLHFLFLLPRIWEQHTIKTKKTKKHYI